MDGELDIASAVSDIGAGLGFEVEEPAIEDAAIDSAVDEAAKPAEVPTEKPAVAEQAPVVEQKPAIEPPKTWRPAAAAKFSSMDPEVQAEVLKREEDMHRGLEGYKVDANFGKTVKQVLDPYLPVLRQHNIDPVAQIDGLMQAHQTLALGSPEQKAQLFQKLATDYGVDLKSLSSEPAWVDPEVVRLRKEMADVKSTLSAGESARQKALVDQQRASIEAFAADPANVHFNTVLSDMTDLVQKGQATTLKDAYEKAVWLNPTSRAAEMTRQQAESSAKAQAEADAKAAAAKASTAANVRTRAKGGSATAPLGSMDDTMQATLDKIKSRS